VLLEEHALKRKERYKILQPTWGQHQTHVAIRKTYIPVAYTGS